MNMRINRDNDGNETFNDLKVIATLKSFFPNFALRVKKNYQGLNVFYFKGQIIKVYGCYLSSDGDTLAYIDGDLPKENRQAHIDESYENEAIFAPIPKLISEINLTENSGIFEIVIVE